MVVVGIGSSGGDLAAEISRSAAKVRHRSITYYHFDLSVIIVINSLTLILLLSSA